MNSKGKVLHVCLVYGYLSVSENRFKQQRIYQHFPTKGSGAEEIRENGFIRLMGLLMFFSIVL